MKPQQNPRYLKRLILAALAVILFLVWTIAVDRVNAAPVNPVADTVQPDTRCAGGLWSVGPCPAGFELQGPVLTFTDLISGPDTGLGDGLGSGAIVTVWGQNLGSTQGSSTIEYCDSLSVCRPGHVYYWKNADGTLPGGPANLYESHRMQEIAFSIPDSALGLGRIKVVVNGVDAVTSSGGDLAFTVRAGDIYHVAAGGSNANPCTFASPCAFIDAGQTSKNEGALGYQRATAGSIIYSQGVTETGQCSGGYCTGMWLESINGTESLPIVITAYPGTQPSISSANRGMHTYLATYISLAKYKISTGYGNPADPPNAGNPQESNQHIKATMGRYVGNHLTQIDGTCQRGWSGSIVSNGANGDNVKIYGNHIEELGCDNATRFQHTLYMSNRASGVSVRAWEMAYNFLDNNNTIHGLHNYDETYSGDCDFDVTGTLKIHNNVVWNQRGSGITVAARDLDGAPSICWTADIEIYNNVLINVGQGVAQEEGVTEPTAIRVFGDLGSTNLTIANNTTYGYGETSSLDGQSGRAVTIDFRSADPTVNIRNNAFIQTLTHVNLSWINSTETITSDRNLFWNTVTGTGNNPPAFTNNIIADPLITLTGPIIQFDSNSPIFRSGTTSFSGVDIYGRAAANSVGAVEGF